MAAININDVKIGFSDQFFFDTNIWLLLFGTVASMNKKEQKEYSVFFNEVLQKDKPIYITSMIISEFANVLLKRDYKQWIATNKFVGKNYKLDFVGTRDYVDSVDTISILIKKILKLAIVVGDNFNALDSSSIFNNFKAVDFNDSYILELARVNNYKLITNDTDYLKLATNVDIISAQV
ncbi:putative nucleic acid-binding protein [Flavobacterium sp. 28YEA47A]|uniref:PIN domain-containing protein n=1 Tax=Flavobacterium sp. 28YEA47A TaxID=3156276 RepID=UPI003518980A